MPPPLVMLLLAAALLAMLGAGLVRTSPAAQADSGPAASAAPARTSGARPVDLALVLPKGVRDAGGLTAAAVRAQVAIASAYWSEQTGGAVRFEVAAVQGWYRSALPCADGRGIWSEASARFGGSGVQGRHLLIVVPPARAAAAGCGYGFGTQGEPAPRSSSGVSSLRGQGAPTGGVSADGGTVFITNATPSLLAHELGHNLGIDHAGSLTCAGAQDGRYVAGRWPRSCALREYDDLYDVMGYSSPGYGEGSLNAAHLDQLGFDPTAVRAVGPGTSTYLLPPLSSLGAAGRGLRLADPSGPVYYLEYRTPRGRDAAAVRTALRAQPGLRVLRADPRLPGATGTLELDATPPARVGAAPAPGDYDRALPVGGVFTAASGQVSVRLDRAGADGARVTVHVGPGAAAVLGAGAPSGLRAAARSGFRVVPTLVAGAPRVVPTGRAFAVSLNVRSTAVATGSRWAVTLQRRSGARWLNVARVLTAPSARGVTRSVASVRQPRGRAGYRWVVTGLVPRGARVAVPPAGRAPVSRVVSVTAR